MEHLRVKYGKYLNQINTDIPVKHIILEQSGGISRSVEPGEPNLPTGETYTVAIRNRDIDGTFLYPLSFWQNAARSEVEGATQELQLYVEIFVEGVSQFTGILKRVRYDTYDTVVFLEIGDLAELLRVEDREMLKAFEFEIPRPLQPPDDQSPGIIIHAPATGYNDLPTLLDLEGTAMPHQTLTFQLFTSGWTGTTSNGKFDTIERDGSRRYPFAWHLGWQSLDYVFPVSGNDGLVLAEQDSPRWIQIGDITLWTRVKVWVQQVRNSAGSRSRQELWCTIWHSAVAPAGGVIPRGRFIWDGELITTDTQEMKVIFHEPNFGFDNDIAVYAGTLPLSEKFIFGVPYTESGSNIVLTSDEYAFFDVIGKITEIINTDVSARHTDGKLAGWVQIDSGAKTAATAVKSSGWIQVTSTPPSEEQLRVSIFKGAGQYSQSDFFSVLPGDSLAQAMGKMATAINNGSSGAHWDAQVVNIGSSQYRVDVTAKAAGTEWNGYGFLFLLRTDNFNTFDEPLTGLDSQQPTSGGVDGDFVQSGIDIYIGEQLFATTADITVGEAAADVAQKVFNALDAVSTTFYEFFFATPRINIESIKNDIEAVRLDVKETGVQWSSQTILGSFDFFDVSKLHEHHRLAFFSDVIMFGWLEQNVIESLVSAAWQVSAQVFTVRGSKIAIHSRNWFETFPEAINDPDFDAVLLLDQDWEPTSGNTYDEGFKSYETTPPVDIVEINNVISKSKTPIYADRNGARNTPTLKNKPVRTGNFRTHDLGVQSRGNVLRYSPDDNLAPYAFGLERFLPTAQTQLNLLASTFFFPNPTTRLRIYLPDYPTIDLGSYVYGQDFKLWFVKGFELIPRQLVVELEIQFRKDLVDEFSKFIEQITVAEKFAFLAANSTQHKEQIGIEEHFSQQVTDPET